MTAPFIQTTIIGSYPVPLWLPVYPTRSHLKDAILVVLKTQETFGSIDILVNNAGITRDNIILRMKEEEWDDVISINLKKIINCID